MAKGNSTEIKFSFSKKDNHGKLNQEAPNSRTTYGVSRNCCPPSPTKINLRNMIEITFIKVINSSLKSRYKNPTFTIDKEHQNNRPLAHDSRPTIQAVIP